jgi:hypothetical protein
MADTSAGFRFSHIYGSPDARPTVQNLLFKDTETLTKGDLVNLESGEVDLAATNDTALLGAVLETKAGTDSTTRIEVITDPFAVYKVWDANARVAGATLDIAGTTGAMTVAASLNVDLTVVAESTATEETLVMLRHGETPFTS